MFGARMWQFVAVLATAQLCVSFRETNLPTLPLHADLREANHNQETRIEHSLSARHRSKATVAEDSGGAAGGASVGRHSDSSFVEEDSSSQAKAVRSVHSNQHELTMLEASPTTNVKAAALIGVLVLSVCCCVAMFFQSNSQSPGQGHAKDSRSVRFQDQEPETTGSSGSGRGRLKPPGGKSGNAADEEKQRALSPSRVLSPSRGGDTEEKKLRQIEDAAQKLATTCKKLPKSGEGMILSGAKSRYIAMKPTSYDENASWSSRLRSWRKGYLGYWTDEKNHKAGNEPKGQIALSAISKVAIEDKVKEQVVLKYKQEQQEDQYLILQFPSAAVAAEWRDNFRILRMRL